MTKRFLLAATLAAVCSAVSAQELYGTNNSTIRESATPGEYFFQRGVAAIKANDYRHAVEMYKVAASWAYKPAEFNLGVIFAKGDGGVPIDLPQSYAWMVLAAERGDKQYVQARDRLKAAVGDEGAKQGEILLVDMRKIYGDEVALQRAKRKWHDVLANATGSHVGFTGGNMQAGNATSFRGNPTSNQKPKNGVGSINSTGDIIGGSGTDGSIAYRDLRSTDNPYDPRFSAGIVTVGEVEGIDPKKPVPKPAEDESKKSDGSTTDDSAAGKH
ncbi:MAG: sel1 repeat family protein [Rudaea sp.]